MRRPLPPRDRKTASLPCH
uniref:Uncharacterized protein n=1 Tax=Rhizophora mucronata TaxID=61149 RepID=A0A2P2PX71_RHIMU